MSSSSTVQQEPLQPTLGCEFGFILLIRNDKGTLRGAVQDDAAIDLVRRALSAPLKVICESCKWESVFTLPMNSEDTNDSNKWQVVHERTLYLDLDEIKLLPKVHDEYDIHPFELRSRIFEINKESNIVKTGCHHSVTWSEEITGVLNRLNRVFRQFTTDHTKPKMSFLHLNRKCGFHVHVGSNGRPFSSPMVKGLLSLVVACEKQIDQLHSTDRITGFDIEQPPHALPGKPFSEAPVIDSETYNLPHSMLFTAEANAKRWKDFESQKDFSKLKEGAAALVAKHRWLEKSYSEEDIWVAECLTNIDAWLIRIQACNNIDELQNLVLAPGRRCTLNIDNLSDEPETEKRRTIEFRQHKGTLQPQEACSFIDFAVSLVTFGHNVGERLYNAFDGPGRIFRQPNFTSQQLCARIGCRLSTQSHFQKKNDKTLEYFSLWLCEQRKNFENVRDDDPIKQLALYAINDEITRTDPWKVEERIKKKLLGGGYGQFPLTYLQRTIPEDTAFGIGFKDMHYLDNRYVVGVDPAGVNKALPGSAGIHVEGYSSEDEDSDSLLIL